MRWWAGGCALAAVVVLAGCGTSAGPGSGADSGAGASGSRSPRPPSTAGSPASPRPSGSSLPPGTTGTPGLRCATGRAVVAVSPGDAVRRRLCVRPGTLVTLELRPRADDERWTGVRSSAPALVLVSGWEVAADGTARASLRCAGSRGGAARVTAAAKAPDLAGAARTAFTLDVDVVPYPREG
ncbi:hypothetical protein [Streptomyces sp. NPDC127190]|uniref:hypothetical protein n=1 Tax=unclassified Streptomyces TaxID=2593676 RepID=UPI00362D7332